MLLSRKRAREDAGERPPAPRRPERRVDETWFLRDLRPADARALGSLRRRSRAGDAAELFLSVVLEWQRAGAAEPKRAADGSPTSVHVVPAPPPTPLRLDGAAAAGAADGGRRIGAYSPRARRELLRRYMAKRAKRLSQRTVRYGVRKTLANARPRVKGRFVKTAQPLTAAAVEAMQPPVPGDGGGD